MRRNPRAACRINPEGHPRNGENLRKKMRSGKEASYMTCGETFGLPTKEKTREDQQIG
jgi:hypothetical protein